MLLCGLFAVDMTLFCDQVYVSIRVKSVLCLFEIRSCILTFTDFKKDTIFNIIDGQG